MPYSIGEVNALAVDDFIAAFGDVVEHSPWVAAGAADGRPFVDRDVMVAMFAAALRGADKKAQGAVLRAHPDLAGRAAIVGKLTQDSTSEQSSAGLDRLTATEFARFNALNDAYKARFDIPFIYAVKGATKDLILASFEQRIDNDQDHEFANAIDNVCRIISFRLADRVGGG